MQREKNSLRIFYNRNENKSVLQTKLNSMCKAKFILIKVRVIALYSDLSYTGNIYKINVKERNFPHFIIKTMVFSKL